jgi:hypothetical protein
MRSSADAQAEISAFGHESLIHVLDTLKPLSA